MEVVGDGVGELAGERDVELTDQRIRVHVDVDVAEGELVALLDARPRHDVPPLSRCDEGACHSGDRAGARRLSIGAGTLRLEDGARSVVEDDEDVSLRAAAVRDRHGHGGRSIGDRLREQRRRRAAGCRRGGDARVEKRSRAAGVRVLLTREYFLGTGTVASGARARMALRILGDLAHPFMPIKSLERGRINARDRADSGRWRCQGGSWKRRTWRHSVTMLSSVMIRAPAASTRARTLVATFEAFVARRLVDRVGVARRALRGSFWPSSASAFDDRLAVDRHRRRACFASAPCRTRTASRSRR